MKLYIKSPRLVSRWKTHGCLILDIWKHRWIELDSKGGEIWRVINSTIEGINIEDLAQTTMRQQTGLEIFLEALYQRGFVRIKGEIDSISNDISGSYPKQNLFLSALRKQWYSGLSSVTLELTKACNQKCKHCYLKVRPPRPFYTYKNNILSLQDWNSFLERLRDINVVELTITGGEPLIHPNFFDIIDTVRQVGFALSMNTNGLLLNDKVIEKLLDTPLINLSVSLYSHLPDIHDKITGVTGSHSTTFKNINKAIKAGIPVIMNCPIMTLNQDTISDTIAFAFDRKIPLLCDAQLIDGENERNFLRVQSFRKVAEWIKASRDIPENQKYNRTRKELLFDPVCEAGSSSLAITENGDVIPCVSFRKILGNILNNDILKIYNNNDFFKEIRKFRLGQLNDCLSCSDIEFCRYCMAKAFEKNGCIDKPPEYLCTQSKWHRIITEKRIGDNHEN